ncbi:MAG: acyl carrier protein [Planctomycetes bacterium]|nr:acyl carrier protein [Planctomycetota bacterium]
MSENIREEVIAIVADRFDVDVAKITDTSHYVDDLGADSLDVAEMVMEFEDKFSITIPDDEQDIKTVGDTVAYITKLKS